MKNSGKLIAFGAVAVMCSAVVFGSAGSSANVELSSYAVESSVADLSASDICAAINSYLSQNDDWNNYTVSENDFADNTVVLVSKETNEASDYKCTVDAETGNVKIVDAEGASQAEFSVWDYTEIQPEVTTTTEATTEVTTETTTTEATTETTESTTETTETTTTAVSTSTTTTTATTATTTTTSTTTKAGTTTTTTTKAGSSPKTGVAGVGVAVALMGAAVATAFALRKKED